MIVENTTFMTSQPGDDLPVTYSPTFRKLYIKTGSHEEIYQTVHDGTELFRLNNEEVEKLRMLLKDYERLKDLVKEHYPEDLL
jgi:hypothetical protein